ncbi:MAG TPA: enoyl-CoA hydratase-related protein [Candidatus Saccharimonadia bacterium]|nr:enoyl-CoA hydratase-related protein [Candidatus Saccharimonadia bacterium]
MSVLRVEDADPGVRTLILDRPDALNALDRELKAVLLAALRAAARDRAVRTVILTGAGRAFCAGQDLRERGDGAPGLDVELRERYIPLIEAIQRIEKPIVAAVNGVAAGAGFSLALACDLRVMADTATFISAFGRIGLAPDSGLSWFLPRLVGPARAAQIVMTTDPVDAATAERIGLVNRVVPADTCLAEAQALAARLATGAPMALGLAKRSLAYSLEHDLSSSLAFEAELQGIAGRSSDHAEGVAAFSEKRPARFTGE